MRFGVHLCALLYLAINSGATEYSGKSAFEIVKLRRQERALRAKPQVPDAPTRITIAPCQRAGIMLVQGKQNYYLSCIENKKHGGFYHTVHMCPFNLRSISDIYACMAPTDCSECANVTSALNDNF